MSRDGRIGVRQVRLLVPDGRVRVGQRLGHAADHGLEPAGIGAPGLVAIVRGVVVKDQAGALRGQPAGDGVPDAGAPADAGDHRDPAAQRQRVPAQLTGSEFGESHDRQSRAGRRFMSGVDSTFGFCY